MAQRMNHLNRLLSMRKLLLVVLVVGSVLAACEKERRTAPAPASSPIEGREVGDSAGPLVFSYCHTQHRCELATSDADGASFQLLTHNEGSVAKPAWSPNGDWIVFQYAGEKPGIYVIRPSGAELRRLVPSTDALTPFYPCWLDQNTVGFTYGKSFATFSLDGSGIEKHRRAYTAACAPGTVAFPRIVREQVRGEEVLFEQVVVGDLGGEVTEVIARSQLEFSEPALSPDGEQVAFCAEEPAYGSGSWVAVARADGVGKWRRLRSMSCGEITWTPDGEQLVVGPCYSKCYMLVDVETGKARRVPLDRQVDHIDWRVMSL